MSVRLILLLCLLLVPLRSVLAAPAGNSEPLDHIVAVVNDDVILASELEERYREVRARLARKGGQLPPEKALRRQVLEQLILERLQLQLADRNHIRVDDETLNAHLERLAADNGLTLEQFRQALEREGVDYARFREKVRRQLRIQRLHQQVVRDRVKVTDQEVDNLLANRKAWGMDATRYHLAHILVPVPDGASPEQVARAREKTERLVARLRAGADFAATAMAESAARTALQGGDLGWRRLEQLPERLAEQVRHMKPGDISPPVRGPGGFHILHLLAVREGQAPRVLRQTHVRHILIKPSPLLPPEKARRRAEQLRKRILNGEDFADLARAHSEDTLSAANGGDLGWVNPGQMVPAFEEAMNRLAPGQVSPVVHTPYGYHIIQVLGRRKKDSTREYIRARARQVIRRRKEEEALQRWLRRLRDEAWVEIREPL
ncbi:MAG: molecular chaperone SurA [Gammaproteobacteria bacterium]|nr:MAG: molecular chaperone SurA [Gammaproteobacteria bacterium]